MKRTCLIPALLFPCILCVAGTNQQARCEENSVKQNQCETHSSQDDPSHIVCPYADGYESNYFTESNDAEEANTEDFYRSEHDSIYDEAVYGLKPSEASGAVPSEELAAEEEVVVDEENEDAAGEDYEGYDWSYDDYEPYDDDSYQEEEPLTEPSEESPRIAADFEDDYESYWDQQPASPSHEIIDDSEIVEDAEAEIAADSEDLADSNSDQREWLDEEYEAYDYDAYWHADESQSENEETPSEDLVQEDSATDEVVDVIDNGDDADSDNAPGLSKLAEIIQDGVAESEFSERIEGAVADVLEKGRAALATIAPQRSEEESPELAEMLPAAEESCLDWADVEMWKLLDLVNECGLPNEEHPAKQGPIVTVAEEASEPATDLPEGESEAWMFGIPEGSQAALPTGESLEWRHAETRIALESYTALAQDAILAVARALDSTGRSLQGASRQLVSLTQISIESVETAEIPGEIR